jgi:hypothetical protein
MERTCLAVILAAGDSTRMKSSKSKVLHPVANRPMIAHVVEAVAKTDIGSVALVVGRDADEVAKAASVGGVEIETYLQTERLGTGHAVLAAREAIARGYDDIIVTYGDVPLQTDSTLEGRTPGAGRRQRYRRYRLPHRQADRLRPPAGQGRRTDRHPRGKGRHRRRAHRHLVQQRPDGDQWPQGAGSAGAHRQQQCQGRILSDRSRRDRPLAGRPRHCRRCARGRDDRLQQPRRTRRRSNASGRSAVGTN